MSSREKFLNLIKRVRGNTFCHQFFPDKVRILKIYLDQSLLSHNKSSNLKQTNILMFITLFILVAVSVFLAILWFFHTDALSLVKTNINDVGQEIFTNSLIIVIFVTFWFLIIMTTLVQFMLRHHERSKDELLTNIIRFLPDATYAIDRDGTIIAWNQAMCRLTGKEAEEMIGSQDKTVIHSFYNHVFPPLSNLLLTSDPGLFSQFPSIIRRGESLECEFTSTDTTAELSFWVTATPLYNSSGTIIGAIESIREISDEKFAEELKIRKITEKELLRKMQIYMQLMKSYEASQDELKENYEKQLVTERSLRESEEKFKSLVEYAFEPIAILDMQGAVLFVNRATADMLEVSDPAWLIGRNILEFLAPESHQAVIDDFIKVSQGLDGYIAEYQLITTKGNRRNIESIGKAIVYGGLPADLISIHDVTFQIQARQKLESQNEIIKTAFDDLTLVEEDIRANYNDLLLKERELRESEERFRAIYSMVPDPIILTRVLDGSIIDCNQAVVNIIGIPIDQIIGKSSFEFCFWESETSREAFLEEVLNNQKTDRKELLWKDAKGNVRYLLFSSQILDISGENILLTVGFDLTELKQAEQLLRQSEEMFRNPVEQSPVGIFLAQDGSFIYSNPCLAQMFGYTEDRFLLTPFDSLFSSEDKMNVSPFSDDFTNSDSRESFHELKGIRSDGSLMELEVYTASMLYQGKMAIYGTIIDVTYRKQMENARLNSERMYRLITENMKDVVWILDPQTWYFRYVSPSVRHLLGYTAEEMMAKSPSDTLDPNVCVYLKDFFQSKCEEFLQNPSLNEYMTSQLAQPCKDGSQVMIEMITNFFMNEENGRVEILGVSRDINERKRAEQEIERKSCEIYEKNEQLFAANEELTAIEDERRKAFEELALKQALLTEKQESLRNAQAIAHIGNWDWKIQENIFYASEEFYVIFGFDLPGFVPSFSDICIHLSVQDQSRLQELLHTLQSSGSAESIDITILRSDGTERILHVRGKSEYNDDNEIIQITLIVFDVTKQRQMEKELLEAAHEKEILLREIHHRVKNNMQVISSLISMQSRSLPDSMAKDLFKETQTRVRTLSLVHEMLYKSDNLNNINYRKYIQSLSNYLMESYAVSRGKITCIIPNSDVQISIEKAVPCSLIITELVTNSLKYAFSEGMKGEISIDFQYNCDLAEYVLDYRDNGKGFSEDKNDVPSAGFGSTLIRGLTRQLSGTMEIDTPGCGVHYTITFPGSR